MVIPIQKLLSLVLQGCTTSHQSSTSHKNNSSHKQSVNLKFVHAKYIT